jgi:acyl-CoA-binding protein
MTPVIPTCRSVFQQIRKFMFFYQIPSWNNLNSRAKSISFDFVSTFKREYEACMKLDASRRREEHTQYVILVDDRRKKYGKKRRAVVSEEEEEEGEGSDSDEVKRPTMHETFSKRIKRDLE